MRIFKYQITPLTKTTITVPIGSTVLSAANQGELIQVWVEVTDDAKGVMGINFHAFPTGTSLQEGDEPLVFLGTVLMDGGNFVQHIFYSKGNK